MFWKLTCEESRDTGEARHDGRYVVHRHRDADGVHLDLRLEVGDSLLGWRIDGDVLETGAWATNKPPHPLAWLTQDGDAVREDEGLYLWLSRSRDERRILLRGRHGDRILRLDHVTGLPPAAVRDLCAVLEAQGIAPAEAPRLLTDGLTARQRATARLCGLGRELDGDAFDEPLWRRTLATLGLDELHTQLRAYEIRFDAKYPPEPVSQPEPLPDDPAPDRAEAVLTILRDL